MRGPRKHMKRLNAPKIWMLNKLGGIWAPRPSTGPHKLRESLPLTLILRNRLKYALTRAETQKIVMRRLVSVDGKVRTDMNFPTGFQDVVSMPKTGEDFRIMYDHKGRFSVLPIKGAETKFKLCQVIRSQKANRASTGSMKGATGQAAAIPYIATHDGRTIRFPNPDIRVMDTVKVSLETGRVTGHYKFEVGNVAICTRGANRGRVGIVTNREKHPGDFEIVHLKDKRGNSFATRQANVFIIGQGSKPVISLPKANGIKLTIQEEKAAKAQAAKKKHKKKRRND